MLGNVPFRQVPSVKFPISCLGAGRANPVKVIRISGGTSHLVGRVNAHLVHAAHSTEIRVSQAVAQEGRVELSRLRQVISSRMRLNARVEGDIV